jgi:hypothetical protein
MPDDPAPTSTAARAILAELACAARSGALTPAAALSYAGRLHRELNTLADIEAAMNDRIAEAGTIAAAIASGSVAVFQPRGRA